MINIKCPQCGVGFCDLVECGHCGWKSETRRREMTDEQFIQLERKASLGRCLLNDMQQLEDALRCSEGSHFYNMTVKVFPPYNLPGEPRECVFRMITKELNDQIRDMIRGELTRLKKAFVEL